MITADEARQQTFKVIEERCSVRLKMIEDRIKMVCKEGKNNLCIVNAQEKMFSEKKDRADVVFLLTTKYGYDVSFKSGHLYIYWKKLHATSL